MAENDQNWSTKPDGGDRNEGKFTPEPERAEFAAVRRSIRAKDVDPLLWEPGQLMLDDFSIVRELGEGGMGKVYLVSVGKSKFPYFLGLFQ